MVTSDAEPLSITTFGRLPAADAPTVLCLHGIESHGLRFLGLAQRLPELSIVAPDLRGHGRSPKVGPWTIDQHLADLLPILHGLTPPTYLIGHSYGGLIAWELARAAPDRIDGLVLVDPAVSVSSELARASVAAAASNLHWPNAVAALADLATDRPPSAHWALALDLGAASAWQRDGSLRPVAAAEAIAAGWQHMLEPLRPTPYRGPTLLVEAGRENGLYVSPSVVAEMRRQLGDQLAHVELDVGHTIPADHPDLLAEHVRRFLGR